MHGRTPGFTMQRAYGERLLPGQRIQQRRLARADASEYRQVQVAMFQLLQHGLDSVVVMRQ